ncbi:MAG: translation initiation factor IF-2 [Candidatus Thermoplasmatota archaeon]|nr:translation initiation factor IF-2 [Candidatus Thermoplasmatota archaeon]
MNTREYRQPIVCVLGHVDHGKTSILDSIRGTTVAAKEAGGITQRIGATDISLSDIEKRANIPAGKSKLKIPGLLFIDTPGHVAFSNMRARGGALADMAILVVDINEGFKPQTIESINILKKFRTPFVVAANKIDLIPLFTQIRDCNFQQMLKKQREEFVTELDTRLYNLVNRFYEYGLTTERYDRISDFAKNIAIVPMSAKLNIGIPDVLMVIAGLAQRYLEKEIEFKDTYGRGTIIELKKEESLGLTLDTVLYQGILHKGDTIALNTRSGPATTKIKAMLVNTKGRSKKLLEKDHVYSASGVRILISDKLEVVSGSPIIVVNDGPEAAFEEILKESQANIVLSEHGVTVKADALGSLEAVSYELEQKDMKIRSAEIGDISKRDITDVATLNEPLDRVILGFNVGITQEAQEATMMSDVGVKVGEVIYSLVEDTEKWLKDRKHELDEGRKKRIAVPSKISIIPEYIFRAAKPVIVGVKVYSGRIKVGDTLMKSDGRYGGTIRSIRDGEVSKQFADAPSEVAVSIEGVTLNRQIFPEESLYVDIPEFVVKELREEKMDENTMLTLEEIIKIKRKENMFWGTKT